MGSTTLSFTNTDPDQSMLPMSYFADDDEDISETKETNMQRDTRDRTVWLVGLSCACYSMCPQT